MDKAVKYLNTYRMQIFNFLKDGEYSIDNNVAERLLSCREAQEYPLLWLPQDSWSVRRVQHAHLYLSRIGHMKILSKCLVGDTFS